MLERYPGVRVARTGITPCAPGWVWDTARATWRDCDVWLVLEGRGHLAHPGGEMDMVPGDCFWFRSGERYVASNPGDRPLAVSYNHFDLLDAAGQVVRPPGAELPPLHRRMSDPGLVRAIAERMAALRAEAPPRWPEINAWFGALLAEVAAEDRRSGRSGLALEQSRGLESLCAEVRSAPERFAAVGRLAAAAGYTPRHFARVFRRHRGEGPKAFVVRARIERAKVLLASTHSVRRIAELLGYSDVYFFSRQFRKVTGVPPTAWRRAQM